MCNHLQPWNRSNRAVSDVWGEISRGVEYEDQIAGRCIYSDSVKQIIIKLLYLYLYDYMVEKNIEEYVLREGREGGKRRDN